MSLSTGLSRQYDEGSLKLTDGANLKTIATLIHSKKTIRMSTFNANTLRLEHRAKELASRMQEHKIDIIGIQEQTFASR